MKTTLEDHCQPGAHGVKLFTETGTSFKSSEVPLPQEIQNRLIKMKLTRCKRAGTQSNQRAAAASSWLAAHARTNFRTACMAWTGGASIDVDALRVHSL